eukprot:CAMPEP_0179116976 /NCGR_PEP_ID=MMETSP0796-20121207/54908_1 /TAXON_ID=73915 /ORGANISM="Pyrodinium bahamense, Strain pbaha01" /LENGTH=99 /DNA_ID=CAMNT_0020815305 /DNA_START=60 /DNA_END=356 /DNA_ORIENTATION=-
MAPKKPVDQLDPETGKKVGSFPSCADAARALQLVPHCISMAIAKGRISGGYRWRFAAQTARSKRAAGSAAAGPVQKKPAVLTAGKAKDMAEEEAEEAGE